MTLLHSGPVLSCLVLNNIPQASSRSITWRGRKIMHGFDSFVNGLKKSVDNAIEISGIKLYCCKSVCWLFVLGKHYAISGMHYLIIQITQNETLAKFLFILSQWMLEAHMSQTFKHAMRTTELTCTTSQLRYFISIQITTKHHFNTLRQK